jgi:hypothetical protein
VRLWPGMWHRIGDSQSYWRPERWALVTDHSRWACLPWGGNDRELRLKALEWSIVAHPRVRQAVPQTAAAAAAAGGREGAVQHTERNAKTAKVASMGSQKKKLFATGTSEPPPLPPAAADNTHKARSTRHVSLDARAAAAAEAEAEAEAEAAAEAEAEAASRVARATERQRQRQAAKQAAKARRAAALAEQKQEAALATAASAAGCSLADARVLTAWFIKCVGAASSRGSATSKPAAAAAIGRGGGPRLGAPGVSILESVHID